MIVIKYAELDIHLATRHQTQEKRQGAADLSHNKLFQEGLPPNVSVDQLVAALFPVLSERPHLHIRIKPTKYRYDQGLCTSQEGSGSVMKGTYYPTYYLPFGFLQYLFYRHLET